MGLFDLLKTGANFIPGVGPAISAGMNLFGGQNQGGGGGYQYGQYSSPPFNPSGGGGQQQQGGGISPWAQYGLPIGMGLLQGLGGMANRGAERDLMRRQTDSYDIRNAMDKLSLSRRKQMQPVYDQASEMLPEILAGRGPVMNFLGAQKNRGTTFDPELLELMNSIGRKPEVGNLQDFQQ